MSSLKPYSPASSAPVVERWTTDPMAAEILAALAELQQEVRVLKVEVEQLRTQQRKDTRQE